MVLKKSAENVNGWKGLYYGGILVAYNAKMWKCSNLNVLGTLGEIAISVSNKYMC